MAEGTVTTRAPSQLAAGSFAAPAWVWIFAFVTAATTFHVALHWKVHAAFSIHQAGLAFFLMVNLMINFWELGLLRYGDRIRDDYLETRDPFRGRELARANDVFLQRIPLLGALSLSRWTGIWSVYALFDRGYSRRGSFGFNIDVCNGISTLIPGVLFAYGMTYEILPARALGILGIAMFWQMFYGTAVYFFQFFHAGRYKGHAPRDIALVVGLSNSLWFLFPLWGLAASVWLIFEDSLRLFTSPQTTSLASFFLGG